MNYAERPLVFACRDEHLVGVLALPEAPCDTGVVVIVGGPQYRAGSHRQFVLLARYLAAQGFTALRFDVRGMGDSSGSMPDFLGIGPDIEAAIDVFAESCPSVRKVVLWGLCDGASAALLYLDRYRDPRVFALALANPWVRSEHTLARVYAKHYYGQRLLQAEFWQKLIRGGIGVRALKDWVRTLRLARGQKDLPPGGSADFRQLMARAWERFGGPVLLLLSGNDHTAKEFQEWLRDRPQAAKLLALAEVQRLAGADHTFSAARDREAAEAITARWLEQLAASPARKSRPESIDA